jgi:HPt (histidine-containing phosphotransfer) domain-containing protein
VAGLDTASGLKNLAGRRENYLRVLRSFVTNYPADSTQIQQHLAAGRSEDAQRLAHSVKGAAGTLGAVILQEQAAALEAALKRGDDASAVEVLALAVTRTQSALSTALRTALDTPAT